MVEHDVLLRILDLARWAPSGDNTQPWRFEIVAEDHVAVHGFDTRDWCVYDFSGHASHMAHGALLETIRIAATAYGLRTDWAMRAGSGDAAPVYDVRFVPDGGLARDPLFEFIETRSVQRRPMRTTPLTDNQRKMLAEAAGSAFELRFFESLPDRIKVARLLWDNARIRLTCPEAFTVHRDVIEWGARYSEDRIPEQAVGVDPFTAKLMKWVMRSWARVEFFNRYLLGTVAPRIQLDLIPALACAGHLLLRPVNVPAGIDGYVAAGMAMQRLWLTAASLGLHLQPEMTPVIFRWYVRAGVKISAREEINGAAAVLADRFERAVGAAETDPFAFFCRVGCSASPRARSLRKNLRDLLVSR